MSYPEARYLGDGGESSAVLRPAGAPPDLVIGPGAPREGYFETLAEIAASGRRPGEEEWAGIYGRHDQYMV